MKKTPYPLVHVPTPGSERMPTEPTSAADTLPRGPDTDTIGPTGGGHAGVEVGVAVTVGVAVPVNERDGVCETVAVDDSVLVELGVPELLPVPLALPVVLPVALGDGVHETLPEALRLVVALALAELLVDALRRDATLRPRYVMAVTAPSSASHSAVR